MIVAAEWAETVLDRPDGRTRMEAVLADEVTLCQRCGDVLRSRQYQQDLQDFRLLA
jgi:hypothetical protein